MLFISFNLHLELAQIYILIVLHLANKVDIVKKLQLQLPYFLIMNHTLFLQLRY